ncbi:MAG: hypothetical protein J6N45_07860 [Alphaproteobacteria bacterium]|nr:hypothetical protein [Alphaproteobacteria bacterium]
MARNKEQIITDMLDNGLLSDEDAERYLADKSVSAAELEEIKRLIQLCDNNQKYIDTGQTRPIEELFNEVEEKYFSEQSDESMTDSVIVGDDYSKEEQEAIEDIIRRGIDDIKNGRVYTEEEFFKEIGLTDV